MSDAKELSAEEYTQVLLEVAKVAIEDWMREYETSRNHVTAESLNAEFNRRFERARKLVQS